MASNERPHMPQRQRAKQFAPFAALSGFELALERKRQEIEELATSSVRHEEAEPVFQEIPEIDYEAEPETSFPAAADEAESSGIMEIKRVKRYVSVLAEHTLDGETVPLRIRLENKIYKIEDAKATAKTAMFSDGSSKIRYRIHVNGKETYLYQERDRWYVEAKRA